MFPIPPPHNPSLYIIVASLFLSKWLRRRYAVTDGAAGIHRSMAGGTWPSPTPGRLRTGAHQHQLVLFDRCCRDEAAPNKTQGLAANSSFGSTTSANRLDKGPLDVKIHPVSENEITGPRRLVCHRLDGDDRLGPFCQAASAFFPSFCPNSLASGLAEIPWATRLKNTVNTTTIAIK